MAANISTFFSMVLDTAWVVELVLNAIAWTILCWQKDRWKVLIPATLGTIIAQACIGIGLYAILGMHGAYPLLNKMLKGFLFFLFLHLFATYQWKTKLLIHFALFNAMLSITALAGQSSMLTGAYIAAGTPEAIVRCTIETMIPLTAVFLRRYNFDEFASVPKSCNRLEWILCCGILVVAIAESFLMTNDSAVVISFMASYFSLVVTSLVMIQAVYAMCTEQKDILDLQAEKQRFQTEREISKMAQTTLDDLRCIRHDLKNQYSYMQILLTEKRYEELSEYFQKLRDNMPAQLNLIDCGNHTVNTVLNMEFSKLRSDQITIEHQLVVPPVLPFPDRELCAVIANMLDNAADECRRLLKDGWLSTSVRIEIYPHQSYLYIRCINSTDRKTLNRNGLGLLTTKHDKQLHGFGTRIIAKLAEKYNGCAQYTLEDNLFVAQVMMDMTWEGEKHEN